MYRPARWRQSPKKDRIKDRLKVTVVAITANEPAVNDVKDKQIRFDIACKTGRGSRIITLELAKLGGVAEKPVREMAPPG